MIQECHKPAEMHLSIGETLLSPNATARGYASRQNEKKKRKRENKQPKADVITPKTSHSSAVLSVHFIL